MPIARDKLMEMCAAILEARQLLARLGTDLKTVEANAPNSASDSA